MKRKSLLVILATLFIFGWASLGYAVEKETVFSTFAPNNVLRVVNGKEQNLSSLIDRRAIVINAQGLDDRAIRAMEKRWGLKSRGRLAQKQDWVVFEFVKTPTNLAEAFRRWNDISRSTSFTSLIFRFPEGEFALSGEIRIEWKKFFPQEEIKKILSSANLEVIDFDQSNNVTQVRVTSKSGKNVFMWAVMFDPINDLRVLSARVEFVRLQNPVNASVEVLANCLENSGSGAPVGSVFCYRINFWHSSDTEISFDDLSVNTKLLRSWLPQGLNQDLRIFKGERIIAKALKKNDQGEILDQVLFKIQILRSGEFTLPPLKFYYGIAGNVEGNKKRLEGILPEMNVLVSPLAPPLQQTVNDIPHVSFPKNVSLVFSRWQMIPWWAGVLVSILGGAFISLAWLKLSRAKKEKSFSPEEEAKALWDSEKTKLAGKGLKVQARLLKEILGVYYFSDRYRLASCSSSDWPNYLGEFLSPEMLNRSRKFLSAAEGDAASGALDVSNLVPELFGWDD